MPEMGNAHATMGSAAAGRGQFHWRCRSVAVLKVGSRLAFCAGRATYFRRPYELRKQQQPRYDFSLPYRSEHIDPDHQGIRAAVAAWGLHQPS